jgi:DNA-binding CsgD family transcriptional regulator
MLEPPSEIRLALLAGGDKGKCGRGRISARLRGGPWEKAAKGDGPHRGPPRGPGALTETELRVAELIASGATSRQAADALLLTPWAVQANLARFYRKLGCSLPIRAGAQMSRTEAASSTYRAHARSPGELSPAAGRLAEAEPLLRRAGDGFEHR